MHFTWIWPTNPQNTVYAAHVLEHLDDASIGRMLAEAYRVLRPGGGIRIEVPDAELLLNAWRETTAGCSITSFAIAGRASSANSAPIPAISPTT